MTVLRQTKGRVYLLLLAVCLLAALLAGCHSAAPNLEVSTAVPPELTTSPSVPEPSLTEPFVNECGLTVLSAPEIAVPKYRGQELWYDSINTYTGVLLLEVPEEIFHSDNIYFEVTVDSGSYYVVHGGEAGFEWFPPQFTVKNGTQLCWECSLDAATGESFVYTPTFKEAYTRIVIYDGEHIIGYAVLRYESLLLEEVKPELAPEMPALGEVVLLHRPVEDYSTVYRVVIVESCLFPLVDGQYQNVTLEYVNARLEDACIYWKLAL